jgi:hypothetical protein
MWSVVVDLKKIYVKYFFDGIKFITDLFLKNIGVYGSIVLDFCRKV